MSHPVKLSDELVLSARLTGEIMGRSIASQIEFWACLGRAVEDTLPGKQTKALAQRGASMPLSECIRTANTEEGRKRLAEYLESEPYPHFQASDTPGVLIRTDADGKRTLGRFVKRKFEVIKELE